MTEAELLRRIAVLRAGLESVCNVADRAGVLTAREALERDDAALHNSETGERT